MINEHNKYVYDNNDSEMLGLGLEMILYHLDQVDNHSVWGKDYSV